MLVEGANALGDVSLVAQDAALLIAEASLGGVQLVEFILELVRDLVEPRGEVHVGKGDVLAVHEDELVQHEPAHLLLPRYCPRPQPREPRVKVDGCASN